MSTQTHPIDGLPGYTATIDVTDGWLSIEVRNTADEDAAPYSVGWQI